MQFSCMHKKLDYCGSNFETILYWTCSSNSWWSKTHHQKIMIIIKKRNACDWNLKTLQGSQSDHKKLNFTWLNHYSDQNFNWCCCGTVAVLTAATAIILQD